MAVVDKYEPVDATPRRLDPAAPAFAGLAVTALVLAGFSTDTLVATRTYTEELPVWAAGLLDAGVAWGEASGLAAARRALEAASSPLDEAARVLKKPLAPLAPAAAAAAPTEAEAAPDLPPGERWAKKVAGTRRPQRILVVGASSIQHAIGTELERELNERYDGIEVLRRGKVATGLTRPDVFDWPKEVDRLLAEFRPDVVIAQFGGNDGQNIVSPTKGPQAVYTPGWEEEYGRRLTDLTTAVESTGAEFVILGMPVMRSEAFTRKAKWLNDLTERFVEAAGGVYVPIDDLSVDANGAYEETVRFAGQSGRMRLDDGIHFTRLGGMYVAYHLTHRLERLVRLVRKAPEAKPEAPPVPRPAGLWALEVPSAHRGRSTLYAFVPEDVPVDGLPVWYLLHGAWDRNTVWSDRLHDELARLAAEQRVILALPDGEPFGYWLDATEKPGSALASWFLDELVPFVDRQLPSNGRRAISGLSMGGHGALTLALARPGTFLAATSMSGVVDLTEGRSEHLVPLLGELETHREAYLARSALHLVEAEPERARDLVIALTCGEKDRLWPANVRLHEALGAKGVPHTWTPQPGGHTWDVWSAALPLHADVVLPTLRPPSAEQGGPGDAEHDGGPGEQQPHDQGEPQQPRDDGHDEADEQGAPR